MLKRGDGDNSPYRKYPSLGEQRRGARKTRKTEDTDDDSREEAKMSLPNLIRGLKNQKSTLRKKAYVSMWMNWEDKLKKLYEKKEELKKEEAKGKAAALSWYRAVTAKEEGVQVQHGNGDEIQYSTKLVNPELKTQSPYEVTKDQVPNYIKAKQAIYNFEALEESILDNVNGRIRPNRVETLDELTEKDNFFKKYARSLLDELVTHLEGGVLNGKKVYGLVNLSGRNAAKAIIVNKLIGFFDNWRTASETHNIIFLGDAGTGKSFLANILANVLATSGILLTDTVLVKSRADFVGEYMGQTALKTNALLSSAYEGVLFLDEAYDLTRFDEEKKDWDSYGAEAVTELIQFLSQNKGCVAFFAAGYRELMLSQFLEINEGIRRRFPTIVDLRSYTGEQMAEMLRKMVEATYGQARVAWGDSLGYFRAIYNSNEPCVKNEYPELSSTPLKNHPRFKKYFDLWGSDVPVEYVQRVMKEDSVDPRILSMPDTKYGVVQPYMEESVYLRDVAFNNQAGDVQNIGDRLLKYLTLTGRAPYEIDGDRVQPKDIAVEPCDIAFVVYNYAITKKFDIARKSLYQFLQSFVPMPCSISNSKKMVSGTGSYQDNESDYNLKRLVRDLKRSSNVANDDVT